MSQQNYPSVIFNIYERLYQGGNEVMLPDCITAVLDLDCSCERDRNVPFVIQAPIMDGPYPGIEWLETVVGLLSVLYTANHTIFIHCHAGISRSAMVTIAFLMKNNHWSRQTATDWLGKTNDSINPAPAFVRVLREFEQRLGI